MKGVGAENPQEIRVQIDQVVQTLIASWNEHDMPAYSSCFTEDADLVNVLGMRLHGRERIQQQHAVLHRTIFRNSALRALDSTMRRPAAGVMLVHLQWEMTGHETPPGAPFGETRQGLATLVLVEQEARWLVTAFHNTDVVNLELPGT